MEQKELQLLGVSFRTAPAAVREALSFNDEQSASLLRDFGAREERVEAAVLSTCNRAEFYLAGPRGGSFAEDWLLQLRQLRPNAEILRADCLRYRESGEAAARHLFAVACGLDSAILGDAQILGQVKQAMALAASCGTLGNVLEQLFRQAIRAGKRARQSTAIGAGAASIGSALAGMIAAEIETDGKNRPARILIVGAGKVARDAGRHLAKRRAGELTIINRTFALAVELAADCGATVQSWSRLFEALAECDCAIVAIAASAPVLRRELLDRVVHARAGRRLIVVDAGMPRNVESGAPIELIDIDAIRERQEHQLARRRSAVPEVERIVAQEVDGWRRWRASLPMEGVIKVLYQELAGQSREVAERLVDALSLTAADAQQAIERSLKQLLHGHVRRLRELSPEFPNREEDRRPRAPVVYGARHGDLERQKNDSASFDSPEAFRP